MKCKAQDTTQCSGRMCAGYCNKHYLQIKRHGQVVVSRRDKRPAVFKDGLVKIPLGKGAKDGYALVDKEYAHLADDNWNMNHYGYARRSSDKKLLHRLVLDCPNDKVVDHINGNPLDNRLQNIRICTQDQNAKNQKKRLGGSSAYKGVTKQSNGFRARIRCSYEQYELGVFKTAKQAAKAYDNAAIRLFGEFARLNNG